MQNSGRQDRVRAGMVNEGSRWVAETEDERGNNLGVGQLSN
jgi:hypothetical protein